MGETNGSAEDGAGTGAGGGLTPTQAPELPAEPRKTASRQRWRTWLALALTAFWLAFIAALAVARADSLLTQPLNELGDFFAGAFAPIAFLWLVFGYFQQGEELQQNTAALLLQGESLQKQVEEMKASVEQQRELVEVTKRSADASAREIEAREAELKRRAQPTIQLVSQSCSHKNGLVRITAKLRNIGANARAPSFAISAPEDQGVRMVCNPPHLLSREEETSIYLEYPAPSRPDKTIVVDLLYADELGCAEDQQLMFRINESCELRFHVAD